MKDIGGTREAELPDTKSARHAAFLGKTGVAQSCLLGKPLVAVSSRVRLGERMKVMAQVERLLQQGRTPKEVISLGFHKSTVTKVSRRRRKEKGRRRAAAPKFGAGGEGLAQSRAPWGQLPERAGEKPQLGEGVMRKENGSAEADAVAALLAAAQQMGGQRRKKCPHQEDGVCLLHAWASREEIPLGIGEPALAEAEEPRWHIRPSPFYCAICIGDVEVRIDNVEGDLWDDPLAGARRRVACEGCGGKGWIAVHIRCTRCGHETYYGWFPKP